MKRNLFVFLCMPVAYAIMILLLLLKVKSITLLLVLGFLPIFFSPIIASVIKDFKLWWLIGGVWLVEVGAIMTALFSIIQIGLYPIYAAPVLTLMCAVVIVSFIVSYRIKNIKFKLIFDHSILTVVCIAFGWAVLPNIFNEAESFVGFSLLFTALYTLYATIWHSMWVKATMWKDVKMLISNIVWVANIILNFAACYYLDYII